MKTHSSSSLEETRKIASEWLGSLEEPEAGSLYGMSEEAVIAGLSGHLGAGKTAFVKEIAALLGVKEEVTSPTFVLMKIYATKHHRFHRLVHIDAYRLERREELEALNFESLVADPHNLIMIEWPENVGLKEFARRCNLKFEIREGKYAIAIV